MKKILSTIVAALVAVSFAGFVFAVETPPMEGAPGSQQQMKTDAAGKGQKVEKAPAKKVKKTKKAKKATKKEVKKDKDTAAPVSENQK